MLCSLHVSVSTEPMSMSSLTMLRVDGSRPRLAIVRALRLLPASRILPKFRLHSKILSRNISQSLNGELDSDQLKGRARCVMTDGGHQT